MKSKPIIFFGNERLATGVSTTAPVLTALVEAGYQVAAVITPYNKAVTRKSTGLEIAEVATKYKIPLINPLELEDLGSEVTKLSPGLGVLVAYGQIIKPEIISLLPLGIINIHPSLLPKYRGTTPIESAILNGDSTTGVSVMRLVKELDAGPVYSQSPVELDGNESKQALADRLSELGSKLVLDVLPKIFARQVEPEPQDESNVSFTQKITSGDAQIDWTANAQQIERQIRAYAGWPKSKTTVGGLEVTIHQSHIAETEGQLAAGSLELTNNQLAIQTGQGVLIIDRLQLPGKPVIDSQAFLAGYRDKLGFRN